MNEFMVLSWLMDPSSTKTATELMDSLVGAKPKMGSPKPVVEVKPAELRRQRWSNTDSVTETAVTATDDYAAENFGGLEQKFMVMMWLMDPTFTKSAAELQRCFEDVETEMTEHKNDAAREVEPVDTDDSVDDESEDSVSEVDSDVESVPPKKRLEYAEDCETYNDIEKLCWLPDGIQFKNIVEWFSDKKNTWAIDLLKEENEEGKVWFNEGPPTEDEVTQFAYEVFTDNNCCCGGDKPLERRWDRGADWVRYEVDEWVAGSVLRGTEGDGFSNLDELEAYYADRAPR